MFTILAVCFSFSLTWEKSPDSSAFRSQKRSLVLYIVRLLSTFNLHHLPAELLYFLMRLRAFSGEGALFSLV